MEKKILAENAVREIRRMPRHRDSRSTERYAKLADGALVEAFTRAHPRRIDSTESNFACAVCAVDFRV